MGISVIVMRLKAASLHYASNIGANLGIRNDLVNSYRLSDDRADSHSGRKRGIGILENELKLGTKLVELLLGDLSKVVGLFFAIFVNRSVHCATFCNVIKTENGSAESGLATTGLTNNTEGSASLELKGHTVNGAKISKRLAKEVGGYGEILLETVNFKNIILFRTRAVI